MGISKIEWNTDYSEVEILGNWLFRIIYFGGIVRFPFDASDVVISKIEWITDSSHD